MAAPTDRDLPTRRSRWRRAVGYAVAGVALVTAGAALTARFIPVTNHPVLALAAWFPYVMVGAGVTALLLLLTRRWYIASLALALTAVAVWVEIPLFVGPDPTPANTVPVRVLTANLREGTADAGALVAIARDRADLLVVQELTPELSVRLEQDGLDSAFPFTAVDARRFAAGIGIWSRYPILQSSRIPGYQLGVVSATIRVPKAANDTGVLVAHVAGPWPQPIDRWAREITSLPDTMSQVAAAAGGGSVIVAGDFNATFDLLPYRRLFGADFRDAAEQSGVVDQASACALMQRHTSVIKRPVVEAGDAVIIGFEPALYEALR